MFPQIDIATSVLPVALGPHETVNVTSKSDAWPFPPKYVAFGVALFLGLMFFGGTGSTGRRRR